jgi:hypothetical protein
LSCGGGSSFIGVGGRRPPSCTSSSRRWIGCLPELHRAASSRGRRRPEAVSWLGPVLVVGWADPWTGAGLRPGKSLSPIFFFFYSFSSCLIPGFYSSI